MQQSTKPHRSRAWLRAALIVPLLCLGAALPASAAGTLDKAKESGKLTIGYGARENRAVRLNVHEVL